LTPKGADEKGELKRNYWFDISRIEILSHFRVMEPPNFEKETS